jgi:putative ABC transport system permease protein
MLRHFLLISWRNIIRNKFYSAVLVIGLAVGIASTLLLGMYTWHELSFDNFHVKKDRIFLVAVHQKDGEEEGDGGWTTPPTGPALKEFFPEVESTVRLCTWISDVLVNRGEKRFVENSIVGADSTIFDIFTFPFVAGDPKTALQEPNSIVITEEIAEKYFGNEDPLGQTLHFEHFFHECKVTGVIKSLPDNTHFDLDILLSLNSFKEVNFDFENWTNHTFATYALLTNEATKDKVESRLPQFLQKNLDPFFIKRYQKSYSEMYREGDKYELFLVPLKDVHLSTLLFENREGKRLLTYALGIIGLIILVLVAINYTNLATVLTFSRAKEVGIRKVTGSKNVALFNQFIVESVLLVFVALFIAIGLIEIVLPTFNALTLKQLAVRYTDPVMIAGLIGFGIMLGIVSGLYPAITFSSFHPIRALKGNTNGKRASAWLRNTLVIFQFTTCIIMIISTLVVYKQLTFMTNKNVGFHKDQIVVLKRPGSLGKNKAAFKNDLLKQAGIASVSFTETIPGRHFNGHGQHFTGRPSDEWQTIFPLVADPDIFETLDLKMIAGKAFTADNVNNNAVLNEAAVRMLRSDNPFDLTIDRGTLGELDVDIVGVVKDFHFKSFHFPIEPLIIYPLDIENDPNHRAMFILVRVNGEDIGSSLLEIENTWKKFAPSYPFEFTFLDDDFSKLFEREMLMTKVYTMFSFISICIACLGLLGLASFFISKRTKEIGIRKIVGASFLNIAAILSRDFLKWIITAVVLGSAISWYIMDAWLQNFAFQTELNWWIFLIAGSCVVLISILTVSWHLYTAATRNPVETLRYE